MPSRVQLTMLAQLEEHRSVDLPTSRAQFFSRARSTSGRFFIFSAAKASESSGPTTGTGNVKRRTLRKSNLSAEREAAGPNLEWPDHRPGTVRHCNAVMLNFLERRPYTTTT